MKKTISRIFWIIRIFVCILMLFACCLATLLAIALKDAPYRIYDISDNKKLETGAAVISDNIPWPASLSSNAKILQLRYEQHALDARFSYLSVTIQIPADQVLDNSAMPEGYHISYNQVQGENRRVEFYCQCAPADMGDLYDWIVQNGRRIYDMKEILLSFLPAVGLLLAAILVVIPYGKIYRYFKDRKKPPQRQ